MNKILVAAIVLASSIGGIYFINKSPVSNNPSSNLMSSDLKNNAGLSPTEYMALQMKEGQEKHLEYMRKKQQGELQK